MASAAASCTSSRPIGGVLRRRAHPAVSANILLMFQAMVTMLHSPRTDRDRRQMLLDLIETRGDKGKWFAAAKDAGFLDVAIECAAVQGVYSTQTRAPWGGSRTGQAA